MADAEHIQLAHGGGGQLTEELIRDVILPSLGGPQVAGRLLDSAVLAGARGALALTTDSYVVQPLEFPGGDIGGLAICGTLNDLAVAGAKPLALSLSLVLAEGMELALLRRLLESAGREAHQAGVAVVTGDTKVVERGSLEGMVVTTAGVGEVMARAELGFDRVREGDRIVLSGPLGEHGIAVLLCRRQLSLSADLASDCAHIGGLAASLVHELGPAVRFMRDPTRGGLASTLVELSAGAGRDVEIAEAAVPVNPTALAAAEMLGLDLLTVANEGKLVAVVSPEAAAEAVAILRRHPIASRAAVIGTVCGTGVPALVEMVTRLGGRRVIQMPYGEELPRIC